MTNQQTRTGLFVVAEIHNAPQNMMFAQKNGWFPDVGYVFMHDGAGHQSPSDEAKCGQAAGSANKN